MVWFLNAIYKLLYISIHIRVQSNDAIEAHD